jgi:hypothetical protein
MHILTGIRCYNNFFRIRYFLSFSCLLYCVILINLFLCSSCLHQKVKIGEFTCSFSRTRFLDRLIRFSNFCHNFLFLDFLLRITINIPNHRFSQLDFDLPLFNFLLFLQFLKSHILRLLFH